jgi:very-short-patch-repair endonuclease
VLPVLRIGSGRNETMGIYVLRSPNERKQIQHVMNSRQSTSIAGKQSSENGTGEGVRARPPAKPPVDRQQRRRARELRSPMTDAERKLWFALRDRRFACFKFRRQVPIGPFIADFVCFEARLVIEVDGGQHADSIQDQRRDRWFAANKFRVMRFWNNEVRSNLEGVMILLAEALRVEEWP